MKVNQAQDALLAWYDAAAREMPWRVGPAARKAGAVPDPYHVWLSEIMLQQTTVAAVTAYFRRFIATWPTVEALAAAEDDAVMAAWAGLGYYARARNLLKCARAVTARGGFPETEEGLLELPGIGPYTAAAVASIAFDRRAVVMDGNVERVVSRLFAIETPLPEAKPELRALADRLTPETRPGDHAQAMMDLGATLCTPTKPSCLFCPISAHCAGLAAGIAGSLPKKTPKPEKPRRHGIAYMLRRVDGAILLERRPEKGLLGGMMGFPGTDWAETAPSAAPPLSADWIEAEAVVAHTFTHFHLSLRVAVAVVKMDAVPSQGEFVAATAFDDKSLPTVMRKVFRVGHAALEAMAA